MTALLISFSYARSLNMEDIPTIPQFVEKVRIFLWKLVVIVNGVTCNNYAFALKKYAFGG